MLILPLGTEVPCLMQNLVLHICKVKQKIISLNEVSYTFLFFYLGRCTNHIYYDVFLLPKEFVCF